MSKLLYLFLLPLVFSLVRYQFALFQMKRDIESKSTDLNDAPVDRLNGRMAAVLGVSSIDANIFEIDAVNGFAVPDGRIFITRGLMNRYRVGDISAEEIASVIAHEIGHVALGHAKRRMVDVAGKDAMRIALGFMFLKIPLVGNLIADFLARIFVSGLSRRDEYAADKFASGLLIKSGIGTAPQKSLFDKLGMMGSGADGVAWLMDHPKAKDRILAIEKNEREWGVHA
ncbi:MAG: M48 family metalloprotease [Albidovulum sp.]|nr:M48 family metalloprotease [Albidovulum sp.]